VPSNVQYSQARSLPDIVLLENRLRRYFLKKILISGTKPAPEQSKKPLSAVIVSKSRQQPRKEAWHERTAVLSTSGLCIAPARSFPEKLVYA
jgi:hypothetical protein